MSAVSPMFSPGIGKAWARLVRAHRTVTSRVEAELKRAGYPPLSWYDVLLELSRAEGGRLAPREIETAMLFTQYNLSRLLDRMEANGLVAREPVLSDARRRLVAITDEGRALRERMWPTYQAAVERHLGSKVSGDQAQRLATILARLIPG